MKKTEKTRAGSPVIRLLFLVYCAVMLWLLFGQRVQGNTPDTELVQLRLNINLVPMRTLKQYWGLLCSSDAYFVRHAVINLAGNVALFVPLGLFLPSIYPKLRRFWTTMLCTLALMLLVELMQYLTLLGSCDVDDLILNLLGTAMGYGFWRLSHKGKA